MNYAEVLKFWFEETERKYHFNATPAFDANIRARFETSANDQAALASRGKHNWESSPEGRLARIIMLDQFPRNMYRGTPAAFTWDKLCREIVHRGLGIGDDFKISMENRSFFYMPLMHSEDLKDQDLCVKMCDQRLDDSDTIFHAKAHRKIIQRFGRFPHRNEILGRQSTNAEIQYLKDGGYSP